ncbi:NADPH-dependent F420 reductase [Microbacterium sp. No. 7]|uniref:NADPH-dependent F420 reductase n=1 Tax=Microbacterium sp. No. 7 TaxID=1714373 RepID=UPI0006D0FF78|nr:NAD(P)-binding domain-containing protein [Microbacterium sp. No. 7]ALJ21183.1 hypothetical protein AOA12_15240 [Microbacterium sp. No. 7]
MRIAFIGTGHVAAALAPPLAAAGHSVVFGSRDPEGKPDLGHPVLTYADAVAGADVVVNASLGRASLDVFRAIGDAPLAGKVLLDLGNAATAEYDLVYPDSSLAEALQELLPSARVVKTANTAFINLIADPSLMQEKGHLFVSGDDDAAKETARGLLADLGWTGDAVIDLGGIQSARGVEHYHLMMLALIRATGNPMVNIKVVH